MLNYYFKMITNSNVLRYQCFNSFLSSFSLGYTKERR